MTAVARCAARRWDIETRIEDAKEVLGLDHYQLVSADGVVRFWHLVACCYLHLDEVRADLVVNGHTEATIGDALRLQQRSQYHLLLRWIHHQFAEGCSVDDVQTLLAVSSHLIKSAKIEAACCFAEFSHYTNDAQGLVKCARTEFVQSNTSTSRRDQST